MTVEAISKSTGHITDSYAAVKAGLPGADLPWLSNLRDASVARFVGEGLPTQKIEAWKYTNLNELRKIPFEPAKPVANGVSARSLPDMIGAEHRLVFVNGHFRKDLSAVCMPPEGATVATFADAIATHPDLVERAIALNGDKGANAFHTLNTAFMTDGLFLHLAEGVQLPSVIEVIHVSVGEKTPVFHHPRNVILADAASSATVVEHYVGSGTTATPEAAKLARE